MLEKGNFVKFQPQTEDFLAISNPRSVLERTLRSFTCLSNGKMLCDVPLDKVALCSDFQELKTLSVAGTRNPQATQFLLTTMARTIGSMSWTSSQ